MEVSTEKKKGNVIIRMDSQIKSIDNQGPTRGLSLFLIELTNFHLVNPTSLPHFVL